MPLGSRLQVSAEPERQHFGGIDAFAVRFSEVARSVFVDNAGNASGLRVIALVTFKLFHVGGDTKKLREVEELPSNPEPLLKDLLGNSDVDE